MEPKIVKLIEGENRMVVTRGWQDRGKRGMEKVVMLVKGYKVLLRQEE